MKDTCKLTTPAYMFRKVWPPDTSILQNMYREKDNPMTMPTLNEMQLHNSKEKSVAYASRNTPASLKHLTIVDGGNKSLNSSQCNIDARPPAEHPERRA